MATVYPVDEIEYGTYQWLRREVAGFLFNQWDWNVLDQEQRGKVDSIIQSGYMQMLYPAPLPSEGKPNHPHQWSFLTPITDLPIVASDSTYDLPDDFAGIIGEFTVKP